VRINKLIANSFDLSRRQADEAIRAGRVKINGHVAVLGEDVSLGEQVELDGQPAHLKTPIYLALHKPVDYVCSRRGQGAHTIYELLPPEYQGLNSAGRLDKDTSGLLLLTNDGDFAHQITHPKFFKAKEYMVQLDKPLAALDRRQIENGLQLEDGPSRFEFISGTGRQFLIRLYEGRNRQIRRTFRQLGYQVNKLHRTSLGDYQLNGLESGQFRLLPPPRAG